MERHTKVLLFISEIYNANPIIKDIFLNGSCCNFYFILKSVFPEARALFNSDHVITQIGDRYYDITGEITSSDVVNFRFKPIENIYTQRYKDDESIKNGEMYDPENKPKYSINK